MERTLLMEAINTLMPLFLVVSLAFDPLNTLPVLASVAMLFQFVGLVCYVMDHADGLITSKTLTVEMVNTILVGVVTFDAHLVMSPFLPWEIGVVCLSQTVGLVLVWKGRRI